MAVVDEFDLVEMEEVDRDSLGEGEYKLHVCLFSFSNIPTNLYISI